MGVRKIKWSLEEEEALNAGITKFGTGKWTKILKDEELGHVLKLRSNIDLKDKWRNLSVTASGGSRSVHRGRPPKLNVNSIQNPENNSSARKEVLDVLGIGSPTMQLQRLDTLILDTIANLKAKRGSSRAEIAEYIEGKHSAPPNLSKLLQAELKTLVDCGKLIKVKHRFRIPPSSSCLGLKRSPFPLPLEVKQECCLKGETSAIKIMTKGEIDAELEKMRSMTPQQAAAMAMKAVAEAEAAILAAERAAKEAEEAEADAEIAKVFAEAALQALKRPTLCTW